MSTKLKPLSAAVAFLLVFPLTAARAQSADISPDIVIRS